MREKYIPEAVAAQGHCWTHVQAGGAFDADPELFFWWLQEAWGGQRTGMDVPLPTSLGDIGTAAGESSEL